MYCFVRNISFIINDSKEAIMKAITLGHVFRSMVGGIGHFLESLAPFHLDWHSDGEFLEIAVAD